jgi:serine/threonine protein kinase/formylglycine-generating enzyme required for sulfatase activity
VDRYRIEEAIGRGGTGTVYRVFDPTTNRTVALKVLLADLSESMRQRFLREIEVQANIRHPNIMPVFDRGSLPDGRPYFTMELLYKPFTLTEIVERRERGTLARYTTLKHFEELPGLISGVMVQVAEGIYLANVENGVIHRDLKPDNVLVDSRTLRPYVIDFGICHVLERDGKLSTGVVVPPTAEEAGIVGTPRYLSPEQARGSVHARTDVWGLGALMHVVLTGEPPIAPASGITRSELQRRVEGLRQARDAAVAAGDEKKAALCDEKLGRLQADGLRTLDDLFRDARDGKYSALPRTAPPALAALVKKAMSPDPSERYVNGRQIAVELNAWVKGGRVRALSEAGGTSAAVDTAKRAMRGKVLPVILLLLGLAGGFVLGGGFGVSPLRSDTDRLSLFSRQIADYKVALDEVAHHSGVLVGRDAALLHGVLARRGAALAKQLGEEPNDAARAAVMGQLTYQRNRVQPQRVRLAAPAGYAWTADQTGERVPLKEGDENLLTPGDWSVVGRIVETSEDGAEKQLVERVRVPLRLPFILREGGAAPDRERPAHGVEVPLAPGQIPDDMVLVAGDRVPVRQAPYATPSIHATPVATFLMGRAEITNSEYAQFLASLPEADATARMPATGFVRDPAQHRPAAVRGLEEVPVVGVRPEDARAYAAWRGTRDGKPTRLLTEAEWLLAAGAPLGYLLPGGRTGTLTDGVFQPALAPAGEHAEDVGPHGERGLIGNAREMVDPVEGEVPAGAVLVKGAGVGDTPDQAVIHLFRVLKTGERHNATGFRIARAATP